VTERVALPATASMLSRKELRVERLMMAIAMYSATPRATPSVVRSVLTGFILRCRQPT
jgi:hypothetical protein